MTFTLVPAVGMTTIFWAYWVSIVFLRGHRDNLVNYSQILTGASNAVSVCAREKESERQRARDRTRARARERARERARVLHDLIGTNGSVSTRSRMRAHSHSHRCYCYRFHSSFPKSGYQNGSTARTSSFLHLRPLPSRFRFLCFPLQIVFKDTRPKQRMTPRA